MCKCDPGFNGSNCELSKVYLVLRLFTGDMAQGKLAPGLGEAGLLSYVSDGQVRMRPLSYT